MAVGGVFARERVTIASGAVGTLDQLFPNSGTNIKRRSNCALVQVLTNPITFTCDGTTPTATVGIEVAVGGSFELVDPSEIKNFKAFANGAGNSVLEVMHGDTYLP